MRKYCCALARPAHKAAAISGIAMRWKFILLQIE
jgi:hypothetical protein